MSSLPDNIIPLLLKGRSNLNGSFKGLSDDQLRLGLMQIVDGLERMDELAEFVGEASTDWRKEAPSTDKEWTEYSGRYSSTPLTIPQNQDAPWTGYQISDGEGKLKGIEELNRRDLENAIRSTWNSLKRFHEIATLFSREASRLMDGEWIQGECDKPEPEEVKAAPSRRRSP